MKNNKIYLIDVTNRDGVQTAKLGLAKLQKTMINIFLNDMGVFGSEFGFPVTRHETNYLNANIELVKMGVLKPIVLSGWVRAIKDDVKKACEMTDVENLNLSISTSEQMTSGKFLGNKTRDDILLMMTDAVDLARKKKLKIVGVNAEDASRT
ncbi:MAG: homocitrate synthase, partial [Candidatus Omnitrophica bacterium CG_4_9_14_0_2_um_filter_42_8]